MCLNKMLDLSYRISVLEGQEVRICKEGAPPSYH